jgi:heterodisulfide reductase subunit A
LKRIGVFICHCGINIASTVDIERVKQEISKYPGVVYVSDYKYICSDPGQAMIKDCIKEKRLEGLIIAACSPTLHEATFRRIALSCGINPYQCEIANIREQCSWVHKYSKLATSKAIKIIKSIIEKLRLNESLLPIKIPIIRRALVIGGGISGIQASLDIANSGYEVILVEREPSIGGHMAQLSETFPTLDCSQCILTPKMVEVSLHPRIKLLTYCEVESISGYVGNFKVKIKKKATYLNREICNGCGLCLERCPTKVASEFDRMLSYRKAIYVPFPQAVPNKPVIDKENCLYFKTGKCKACQKVCPLGVIDFNQKDMVIEEEVGAIIVATGFELYPQRELQEYGGGKLEDVIDGLQFERLCSASGPTQGVIRRPSDGKIPKEVVFVQCAGSRDPQTALSYCSKICCMYTAKHAILYKHRVPDGQAYIFYIDIRSAGKDYEEFVQRGIEEDKILYLRGKVSKIFQEDSKVVVWGADTLTGKKIEIAADMVVLATAIVPSSTTSELIKKLRIASNQYGFLTEAHPKLRPVESLTAGFFLAGCAQAPRDIPEAVACASGAAAKVAAMFSQEELTREPTIVVIDKEKCGRCLSCISVCPYQALEYNEEEKVIEVKEALCEGCGACAANCPSGAIQQRNLTDQQIYKMVDALIDT